MARSSILWPGLASALANVFFGMTVVATRYVVPETDPLTLAFLRNAIATITLLPLLAFAGNTGVRRADLLPIVALGAAQFGVFPFTFTTALKFTLASRGALVFALVPILTLGLAALRRVEPFTRLKLLGALLALSGVLLSVGNRALFAAGGEGSLTGELFMFVTVLVGASYNVLSRPYLQRYPARLLIVYFMAAGTLFLAPFAAVQMAIEGFPAFTRFEWLLVLFVGTFGGSIGYLLYVWALEKGTPARAAVFVPLNPVTATVLAAALLREELTLFFLLGLTCVVTGILLTNHPRAQSEPASPLRSGAGEQ